MAHASELNHFKQHSAKPISHKSSAISIIYSVKIVSPMEPDIHQENTVERNNVHFVN